MSCTPAHMRCPVDCVLYPGAHRKHEKAAGPGEALAPDNHHVQAQFDFYTAPDCWKLSERCSK